MRYMKRYVIILLIMMLIMSGCGRAADNIAIEAAEFASDISINSENMLAIKGNSTISFIHLIRMRSDMYDEVYNRRGLRFLEACCKMIIQIFIVYKTACINELINVKEDFYDLSDKK